MKDFFISYNHKDKPWAEWIAWQLEEAGFSVVFQAWDFAGNWLLKMDQAMRESVRTIAVLSPDYIEALYTHPEWTNAFRLDPTGEKDLLIPVRVQPVELEGLLAQIVYVDLVSLDEAAAVDLLLKRARGERGKPGTRPSFPSSGSDSQRAERPREVIAKPAYPAFDEDMKRLIRARDLLVGWRSRYAGLEDELRLAARKARAWSNTVPVELDEEVAAVLDLAARVAVDLRSLPVTELEFAKAYGLMVHPTVFWGQAIEDVIVTHSSFGSGRSAARKRFNEARKELGIRIETVPDNYAFEMAARVLGSGEALARFTLDSLPRGFISGTSLHPTEDVHSYRTLLVARINDDPRLHLVAADQQPRSLATFAARKLALYPLCAQRNADSTVDLVATDFEHVYWWSGSSPQPSMQYPRESPILHASFASSAAQPAVVTVHSDGKVRRLEPGGGMETVLDLAVGGFRSATLWIDPLEPERLKVLALTDEFDLFAQALEGPAARCSHATLWADASFPETDAKPIHWYDNSDLASHELDGLSCLVVRRQAAGGEGVHFLDPLSLAPIRQPLFIPGFVGDMVIADGRWLAVVFLQYGTEIRPRLALWDLHARDQKPVVRFFERHGDVYFPVVTRQADDAFEMMFVLRTFGSGREYRLCRFRWPAGQIEELDPYKDLRIMPVSQPSS